MASFCSALNIKIMTVNTEELRTILQEEFQQLGLTSGECELRANNLIDYLKLLETVALRELAMGR